MATLTIAKTQQDIGDYNRQHPQSVTQQEAGVLSRFASAAHIWADRLADYKYNQTDWRAIRP